METESSEVYKMIHEGAEVYLNGRPIGNGEVEYKIETPYEEAWYGEMGPSKNCPTKRTFRITIPEGSHPLQGDWIIKRYASDGSIQEATFSGQEEAQRVMQLFQDLGLEGHFELVCRPRAEDVVVTSYRNEPEEEPLDKTEDVDGEGITDPRDLLESRQYLDSDGCVWGFRTREGDDRPHWHWRLEGSSDWDPFWYLYPVDGPWTEYKGQD